MPPPGSTLGMCMQSFKRFLNFGKCIQVGARAKDTEHGAALSLLAGTHEKLRYFSIFVEIAQNVKSYEEVSRRGKVSLNFYYYSLEGCWKNNFMNCLF
jgi:hypothetical protein